LSTAIAPAVKSVINSIEAKQAEIASYLPRHIPIERFVAQVKMALFRQPKLGKCTPASVFESVRTAADLGLDPSGTLGSAYLVPYGETCQLIPGYRGLIDLACRSGFVRSVNAWVIHEKDEWKPPRSGKIPHHVEYFPMPDDDPNPGRVIGAWARAKLVNGAEECCVMTFAQLEAIRKRSPTVIYNKTDSPWFTATEEMYRKCPIRKLMKALPLSPLHTSPEALAWRERFTKAVEMEDAELVEGEEIAAQGAVVDAKKGAEKAKDRLRAVGGPMTEEEKAEVIRREREQGLEPGSGG
jgi:phage RecT family recombinase